jgi:ABC-type Fe3+-hydroxamate transport system substrate-binding protein
MLLIPKALSAVATLIFLSACSTVTGLVESAKSVLPTAVSTVRVEAAVSPSSETVGPSTSQSVVASSTGSGGHQSTRTVPSACDKPIEVVRATPSCGTCTSCSSCPIDPRYALAVTRPGACNDYPVTYRVQVPEADPRVRSVDRFIYR